MANKSELCVEVVFLKPKTLKHKGHKDFSLGSLRFYAFIVNFVCFLFVDFVLEFFLKTEGTKTWQVKSSQLFGDAISINFK